MGKNYVILMLKCRSFIEMHLRKVISGNNKKLPDVPFMILILFYCFRLAPTWNLNCDKTLLLPSHTPLLLPLQRQPEDL
jgi:hypothetical protein